MGRRATIKDQNTSEEASILFNEIKQAFGKVPNLFRTYDSPLIAGQLAKSQTGDDGGVSVVQSQGSDCCPELQG